MTSEYPILDLSSIKLQNGTNSASLLCSITPAIAGVILAKHNYPRNRHVTQRKVRDLASAMEDGSFLSWTTTINFNPNDGGGVWLTDGQHRLSALVKCGKTFPFCVLSTNVSADDAYPKTDRGLARSLKDAIRSGGYAHSMSLSETAVKQAAIALRVILEGYSIAHNAIRVSEDVLLDTLVEKYYDQTTRAFTIIGFSNDTRKVTGRLPLSLWITLYTEFNEDKWDVIDEFISGCATGMRETEDDPRWKVYDKYQKSVRVGQSTRMSLNRGDELGLLLTGWEYWYLGKTSKNNFHPNTTRRVVKGSPNVAGTKITYYLSGSQKRLEI